MKSGTPRPPGLWTSRAVRLVVRALPPGHVRDRYRREFLAELYGMSRLRQLRHATSLLTRAFALRSAVDRDRQPSTWESAMAIPTAVPRKPLLCRLHLHHRWVLRVNPDGDDYFQCNSCGEDLYDVERTSGANIGGNIAGGIMSGIGI
jgi:hypothetical protein